MNEADLGEATERLFAILRQCAARDGAVYLAHTVEELDVPPRPFDEITIDGTFDTRCLLEALNRLEGTE